MYIQNKSWRSHGGGPYTQLQIRQYPKLPFSCGFWPDDVRRRRQLKRSFAPYRPVQSYIVYIPPIFFFLPFSTNSGTYIAFSLSLFCSLSFLLLFLYPTQASQYCLQPRGFGLSGSVCLSPSHIAAQPQQLPFYAAFPLCIPIPPHHGSGKEKKNTIAIRCNAPVKSYITQPS